MDFNSIYLISNGSTDYYPDNTLTSFTNRLPIPISFDPNEKWEIGVESFGFSSNFKNVHLKANVPSLMVASCQTNMPNCEDICILDIESIMNRLDCSWKKFTLDASQKVKIADIQSLSADVNKTGLTMSADNTSMSFSLSEQDAKSDKVCWIFLHESFKSMFGFTGRQLPSDTKKHNKTVNIGGTVYNEKTLMFEGEKYYYYTLSKKNPRLLSDGYDLEKKFPKIVKILCESIEPQIFNSTYSKDLLIFTPNFNTTDDYFFKEIDCIDYIPLLNDRLTDISIKLVDEHNEQLPLLTGHATIIKVNLKKMPQDKKSFNIRLTSDKTDLFPENTNYHFKVKVPYHIPLEGNDWKVCINSINHPSMFATMLIEEDNRKIIFKEQDGTVTSFTYNTNIVYDDDALISEFNFFLTTKQYGTFTRAPNAKKRLTFTKPLRMVMSVHLANLMGWSKPIVKGRKVVTVVAHKIDGRPESFDASSRSPYVVDFNNPSNLTVFKPNYMIVYSNLVKSSVIGGIFSKILKIVPIKETKLNYTIQEFRNKETYELENTEIDIIEIQMRSHDGTYINFLSEQPVILNLEFNTHFD